MKIPYKSANSMYSYKFADEMLFIRDIMLIFSKMNTNEKDVKIHE